MLGVLSHLMALEREGFAQQVPDQSEKAEMLKDTALTLRTKRDQLKRQVQNIKVREACRDIRHQSSYVYIFTCHSDPKRSNQTRPASG